MENSVGQRGEKTTFHYKVAKVTRVQLICVFVPDRLYRATWLRGKAHNTTGP